LDESNLYPKRRNIVADRGRNQEITAREYYMSEVKAHAFGAGFHLTEVKHIGVPNTSLKAIGGIQIIRQLTSNIRELNLENNMVGRGDAFFQELVAALGTPQFALKTLNLSGNQITDKQIELFFNAYASVNPKTLTKVYLSKNLITDRGAKAIKKAFLESPNNI
jgi:Leucine-rich repeat (LRR) protein